MGYKAIRNPHLAQVYTVRIQPLRVQGSLATQLLLRALVMEYKVSRPVAQVRASLATLQHR